MNKINHNIFKIINTLENLSKLNNIHLNLYFKINNNIYN